MRVEVTEKQEIGSPVLDYDGRPSLGGDGEGAADLVHVLLQGAGMVE